MALTNNEILAWVYGHIGGERESGVIKPMVLAMATLAYKDLAHYLIDTDSEQAKKLVKTLSSQTWTNSAYSAPSDMLFHKQMDTTKMSIGTTMAFQVKDRDKLDMATGVSNIYYALEGKTFYIKHPSLTTSSTLSITYYKIPTKDDIDDELRNLFLELLLRRLVPQAPTKAVPNPNGESK